MPNESLRTGWNILRFIRAEQDLNKTIGRVTYDAYRFIAINMIKEEVEFIFLSVTGAKRGRIIDDLLELSHNKKWMDVRLVERKRVLAIEEMKELKQPQEELNILHRINQERGKLRRRR